MIGQYILNGVVSGLIVALPALALTLIFAILKFPNFAIGSMVTIGAYTAWALNTQIGLPLLPAAMISLAVSAIGLMLVDQIVFARLRDRDNITLLVASVGVSFVLENLCRFFYGNAARSFDVEISRPIRWLGLRINHEQITIAAVVLLFLVVLFLVLRFSRLGRAMRAVADNPPLAASRGIERESIVRITWLMVGATTALAGVLIGMDRAIDPMIGWNYQISVFAAAIVGGMGSLPGAVVGALIIGVSEELATLVIPTNYRQAVGFIFIALILLFRPHGLFGKAAVRK